MASFVPDIFIILSAAALILVLVAFWQSLRALLSEDNWSVSNNAAGGYPGRGTVFFEQRQLRQAIEEIRSERDLGRLSQSDFDALDRELCDRENEMLQLINTDQQPNRDRARKLIEEHLMRQNDGNEPRRDNRVLPPRICQSCSASNELDAKYCKNCGNRLEVEDEVES